VVGYRGLAAPYCVLQTRRKEIRRGPLACAGICRMGRVCTWPASSTIPVWMLRSRDGSLGTQGV
jgi:hypothetical protein